MPGKSGEQRERERESYVPYNSINLAKVNLEHYNLNRADFRNVWLRGTKLSWANLLEAEFVNTNMCEASLVEANLTRAKLIGAALINADLSAANLTRASLRGANMFQTNFAGADLNGADLSGTNLTRADLNNASLIRADLTGANLNDADLSNAKLIHCCNSSARLNSRGRLPRGAIIDQETIIAMGLSEVDARWTDSETTSDPHATIVQDDLSDPIKLEIRQALKELQKDKLIKLRDELDAKLNVRVPLHMRNPEPEWQGDLWSLLAKQRNELGEYVDQLLRDWEVDYTLVDWRETRDLVIELVTPRLQSQSSLLQHHFGWQSMSAKSLSDLIEFDYEAFIAQETINLVEPHLNQLRSSLKIGLNAKQSFVLAWWSTKKEDVPGHAAKEPAAAPEDIRTMPIDIAVVNDSSDNPILAVGVEQRKNEPSEEVREYQLAAPEVGQPELVESAASSAPTQINISLSHPERLAKGFTSKFVVSLNSPEQQAESRTIQISSPTLDFSTSSNVQITEGPILFLYVEPSRACNQGFHEFLIAVRDTSTQQDLLARSFSIRVVDYAFAHLSSPKFLAWVSILTGVWAVVLWLLPFLELIDMFWGLAAGTVAAGASAFHLFRLQSLYVRTKVTNNYTNHS